MSFILFVLTYILMPSVLCVLVSVVFVRVLDSVVFVRVLDSVGSSVTPVLADKI